LKFKKRQDRQDTVFHTLNRIGDLTFNSTGRKIHKMPVYQLWERGDLSAKKPIAPLAVIENNKTSVV
jgi:hypothetical protein